ncbi:predicted protein [Nematostella vectensis]|uniref:G-protein coupled receptors family 1 profile domain-containing protein n=1 Tax=Nematostella vectensis TaxID=45351 RepID=A7S2E1_NEMVE|nr:predicted protein [Nematostella vectensis]|eukprot:XP_001634159.1 predicted protein [Nematostella vectensis]
MALLRNLTAAIGNLTGPSTNIENTPLLILIGYSLLYLVTYIVAVLGNIMALLTCYKNYRITTSILLVYIASLAIADLLFTFLTTFDFVYFFTENWVGGNPLCKLQGFLVETSYSASILTLVAISYERLRSVAAKGLARSQRIERRTIICKLIWVVSAIICAPLLYGYSAVQHPYTGKTLCVNRVTWGDDGRQIYYAIHAVIIYCIPLVFMVWAHWKIFSFLKKHAHGKSVSAVESKQRKVTQMLAVVTLIFVSCWTPFILVRALRYFFVYEGLEIWKLTQLIIIINSAVNPILYCFYSGQFRSSFKDMVKCRWHLTIRRGSSRRSSRKTTSRSPNSFQLDSIEPEAENMVSISPSWKQGQVNNGKRYSVSDDICA